MACSRHHSWPKVGLGLESSKSKSDPFLLNHVAQIITVWSTLTFSIRSRQQVQCLLFLIQSRRRVGGKEAAFTAGFLVPKKLQTP